MQEKTNHMMEMSERDIWKIYFNDENLIYSHQRYQLLEKSTYCLFETISGIYPFVKFEAEIAAINDYCCFLLWHLKQKLIDIARQRKLGITFVDNMKDVWDPILYFEDVLDYPHSLLTWKNISADINKCTMLLLWLSYLESSLDEIAHWFCEKLKVPFGVKKKGITYVEHCLERIGSCCHNDLIARHTLEIDYYHKIRKIRNQFVHVEWEQITNRYEQFRLDGVINMISIIIQSIEETACRSGVI